MRKISLIALSAIGICVFSAFYTQKSTWQDLFDGKSLKGWKQVAGDAPYTVENGMIVGTTVKNTGNTFLVTEKEYGDFILELDAKIEGDHNNSGIQTRSHIDQQANNGKGRVYGRQVEIDPTPRSWTGGIYDEARRNWLYPLDLNPTSKSAFKKGEFNHFRIECIGNTTKTWINDIPVSYVVDTLDKTGFIGLQVHSVGKNGEEGKKVYFKNIKIQTNNLQPKRIGKEIYVVNLEPNTLSSHERESGYKLLYDGKTTNNWVSSNKNVFPEKGWSYDQGELRVHATEGTDIPRAGDIVTKELFSAFDLSFEFKLTPGANSGLKYFVVIDDKNKDWPLGLEYQVLDDVKHPDAKMGRDGNRTLASLYDLLTAEKQPRFLRPIGSWNNARIVVYPDNKVEHYLNGVKVLEYVRGSDEFKKMVSLSKFKDKPGFGEAKEGRILLQDHGNEVSFRSIKIREL
ncbi:MULTISPECIES: 3-keto-disaccharide hydrolase [Olivibacter]|uniref:DUF1080 domain-containing protein n=1 Tax=Olivibacter oleidegradans TaxID=760123 RepID=A0ABV6HLD2_9SPHI|nr:DUF1080 domain-containing protein [Olivibacter jilunii]